MSHHKSEDYKLSAFKYYIKNKISIKKFVKFLVVKNNHYQDGFKNINYKKYQKKQQKTYFL